MCLADAAFSKYIFNLHSTFPSYDVSVLQMKKLRPTELSGTCPGTQQSEPALSPDMNGEKHLLHHRTLDWEKLGELSERVTEPNAMATHLPFGNVLTWLESK